MKSGNKRLIIAVYFDRNHILSIFHSICNWKDQIYCVLCARKQSQRSMFLVAFQVDVCIRIMRINPVQILIFGAKYQQTETKMNPIQLMISMWIFHAVICVAFVCSSQKHKTIWDAIQVVEYQMFTIDGINNTNTGHSAQMHTKPTKNTIPNEME